jgi:predicted membrane chloride channel (bestrophin family)
MKLPCDEQLTYITSKENPFLYSPNDLPLNQFCNQIRKEIEYIIYHIPSETENVLMHGR